MELTLLVYAIDVLDKLKYHINWAAVISAGAVVVLLFHNFVEATSLCDKDTLIRIAKCVRWAKKLTITSTLLIALSIVIPKQSVMYTMVAAYIAQQTYETEFGQKVIKVLSKRAEEFLDKELEK